MSVEPFSYKEIQSIPEFPLQRPEFLSATDGIQLAYYAFLPKQEPSNVVIFYHGGGGYTNAAYQWVGMQLAMSDNIGAYMVDIRGHGHSRGPRGDAPTVEQLFYDIDTIIDFAHQKHPQAKIYLAGHSAGAGLILNYGAHVPSSYVAGYICLAPYLGPNSGTLKDHVDPRTSFVKNVRVWVYILGGMSGGRICAHTPAVYFNYSPDILADPFMVPYYTYTMSSATTPYDTNSVFARLNKPIALYIGDQDEQMNAEKIVDYKEKAVLVKKQSIAQIIPHAAHLSILLSAAELICKTIKRWQ
ncbi:MAG TPA: alpha/beta fold hydrolase [Candidatus Babeliales bacterium]|nr:alpha/beta fold hydrolase [Candidatus Babeliales bacterium]